MRHPRLERTVVRLRRTLPRLLWILPCLLLAQCITDGRRAGTSTSVTNPVAFVTGFAILESGAPAAGAEITLRKPTLHVSDSATPASLFVSRVTADSAGKFTVPLVFLDDVYMEIRQAAGPGPSASPEVHLRRWPNGLPLDGKMGTFRLQATGTVTGHIQSLETAADAVRWIGVRGTDNFTRAPDGNPFKLSEVPAGRRELVVIAIPDSAALAADPSRTPIVRDTLSTGDVVPDATTDFGPVFYNNF